VTEYLRLSQIKPSDRIKRVGIWRRNPTEVGWWVALDVGELPHWSVHAFDLVDEPPRSNSIGAASNEPAVKVRLVVLVMITLRPANAATSGSQAKLGALYLASVIYRDYRDFPVIALHEAVIRIMAA
jgi:hypothetical protein